MDWGNAIVRSATKTVDGVITDITMDLHLAGDFKATEKKITWLARPSAAHPLVPVTLLDYDYLITKKKLEENDDVKDFVTPVSEFREAALADANIKDLKKGDIMQFERKGYYIFDGVVDGKYEFINIPDGRAASIASKAAPATGAATPSKAAVPAASSASDTPVETKMYKIEKVYGEGTLETPVETKMYKVQNVYDS